MKDTQTVQTYRTAIEKELQMVLNKIERPEFSELHHMMAYHLGWKDEGKGLTARGKRIRPQLLLLTTAAAGGNWENALPAAASIELVHNFSLLHDDIEDNSPLRRGRPTVWKRWGIPQAINTGDSMFSLAHLAMLRLGETASPEIAFKAFQVLEKTCLHLTQGQFLDISYESRQDLNLEDYWLMVTGKTAELMAACTEIGALVAQVDKQIQESYRIFGLKLGLAFQVFDDYLGIWGDSIKTGKSISSDLVESKKTLPVLFGLARKGAFASRWSAGNIKPDEVAGLANQLAHEGARDYTHEMADRLTTEALNALEKANPQGEAAEKLARVAKQLRHREI